MVTEMTTRVTSWLSRPSLLRTLVSHVRVTLRLLREPRVPLLFKLIPVLAAGYVISPLDFVPEPYIQRDYEYAKKHPWYMAARLVTMNAGAPRDGVIENGTVVVRGNRIEAIGPSGRVRVPAGATRVGASAGVKIVQESRGHKPAAAGSGY